MPSGMIRSEGIYVFKVLTSACKKVITRNWLKRNPPRTAQRLDMQQKIYIPWKTDSFVKASMHRKLWTKESVQKSKRVSNLCKSTDTILCHVIFLDIYFMRIHHGWCNLSGTRVLSLCCSFLRLINNEKNKTGYCPLPHHCCTTVMH